LNWIYNSSNTKVFDTDIKHAEEFIGLTSKIPFSENYLVPAV
jgi:hypothetical protein